MKADNIIQGASLRDQFAMSALTGLLANSTPNDVMLNTQHVAQNAYAQADSMLEERNKSAPSRYGKKKK